MLAGLLGLVGRRRRRSLAATVVLALGLASLLACADYLTRLSLGRDFDPALDPICYLQPTI